eukprot:2010550-Pyramimonas_sp.AAC.1
MRVVRRICDRVNFDGIAGSDIHAREHAGMVSLDCILLQKRLLCLARLVRSDSHALLALLSQGRGREDGSRQVMPWVRQ